MGLEVVGSGIWGKVVDALVAALGAGLAGVLWLNVSWIVQSKRMMRELLSESRRQGEHAATLYRLNGPLLMGMKASLEALRDGKCNGNVTQALTAIEEAKRVHDEHLLGMLESDDTGVPGASGARGSLGRKAA